MSRCLWYWEVVLNENIAVPEIDDIDILSEMKWEAHALCSVAWYPFKALREFLMEMKPLHIIRNDIFKIPYAYLVIFFQIMFPVAYSEFGSKWSIIFLTILFEEIRVCKETGDDSVTTSSLRSTCWTWFPRFEFSSWPSPSLFVPYQCPMFSLENVEALLVCMYSNRTELTNF